MPRQFKLGQNRSYYSDISRQKETFRDQQKQITKQTQSKNRPRRLQCSSLSHIHLG